MEQKITQEENGKTALLESLFSVGAHFGYSRSRRHPSVSQYIFGTKNKVELFDLEKVSMCMQSTAAYMEKLGSERKVILWVGGKNEARSLIEKAAKEISMPYVAGRWIGGTLTNFSEIRKRITRLEELVEKRDKGELESKYTKRERVLLGREIEDLKEHFEGLVSLKELPHALLVIDPKREHIAVTEAQAVGIPTIALLNSDCNADVIHYAVPGNDASVKSIEFFVTEMVNAYKRGTLARSAEQSSEKNHTEDK